MVTTTAVTKLGNGLGPRTSILVSDAAVANDAAAEEHQDGHPLQDSPACALPCHLGVSKVATVPTL